MKININIYTHIYIFFFSIFETTQVLVTHGISSGILPNIFTDFNRIFKEMPHVLYMDIAENSDINKSL